MTTDLITIHVTFDPAGDVSTISECPQGLSPQAWFDALSYANPTKFTPLSGGRGAFRLPIADVEALKVAPVAP